MQHHVVVSDPAGKYWEGAVVDAVRVNELRGRGVATLPCIPDLFRYAGVSGYSKRAWGAGWPLDTVVPSLVCPLTMYVPFDAPKNVEWCARIMPTNEALARVEKGHSASNGVLRLAAGEMRGSQLRAVITDHEGKNNVDVSKLGPPDEQGGWTVYGRAQVHASGEGCYGLALYGFAPGLRIVWLAATLST